MIKLVIEFNPEIGLWMFIVKEDEHILHFRSDFCTCEQAQHVGDLWIRDQLGGVLLDEDETDNNPHG